MWTTAEDRKASRGHRARIVPWGMAGLVIAAMSPSTSVRAQATVQFSSSQAQPSVQVKAPLAWQSGGICYLMNMGQVPPADPNAAGANWCLQPLIGTSSGTSGWTATAGNIYAYPSGGPQDGTNYVDWGDGSFLRLSAKAAGTYGLNPIPSVMNTILYSTRLNTAALNPDGSPNAAKYGYVYRIMVFMSLDGGNSWSVLPAANPESNLLVVDSSSKGPCDNGNLYGLDAPGLRLSSKANTGLWSNFLFERSDGTVQVYYDDERSPCLAGAARQDQQWLGMRTLNPGQALSWSGESFVDNNQAGASLKRAGMASVSEKPSPNGVGTMIVTEEDVAPYQYVSPTTGGASPGVQGVVRVFSSPDGGKTWGQACVLQRPVVCDKIGSVAFNNLAPYHLRSKIPSIAPGNLVLVFRSDVGRQDDPNNPDYDPNVSLSQAALTGNPRWVEGNLYAYTSVDDGASWQSLSIGTTGQYMPGGAGFTFDPGVAEVVLTPDTSNLVFQWGEYLGGLNAPPGTQSLSVQVVGEAVGP